MLRSITSISVLLSVIAVNVLSYFFFIRFDFTEGNIYTLSDSTKQIVQEIPEELHVKAFISKKLPPQAVSLKQNVVDYLEEYEAFSDGNLTLEFTDPIENEEDKQMAQMLGIPELQLSVIEKDQQQVLNAYMGLVVYKKRDLEEGEEIQFPLQRFERFEVLPFVDSVENFEYDLSSAIKKVSAVETKTIGFLSGHEEHQLRPKTDRFSRIQPEEREDYDYTEVLEKTYNVTKVLLTEEHPEIENVDTLVIAGPKFALADYEVESIKNFVAQGGNALFLIDQVDMQQGLQVSTMEEDFSSLLGEWGVGVEPSLIKDSVHSNASFNQGFVTFSVPYPFWPKLRNLSKDSVITAQLPAITTPWVSPLTIEEKEGVNVEVLATSSARYALEPLQEMVQESKDESLELKESEDSKDSQLETLNSELVEEEEEPQMVLKDRVIDLNPQQNFSIPRGENFPVPLAVIAQKEGEGKVFIIGDSDFASLSFAGMFKENSVFFQNIVDAFTLGEELISIRSKGITDRPLEQISEVAKAVIRWGNIAFVSVLVIAFGLIRRMLRNAKKS